MLMACTRPALQACYCKLCPACPQHLQNQAGRGGVSWSMCANKQGHANCTLSRALRGNFMWGASSLCPCNEFIQDRQSAEIRQEALTPGRQDLPIAQGAASCCREWLCCHPLPHARASDFPALPQHLQCPHTHRWSGTRTIRLADSLYLCWKKICSSRTGPAILQNEVHSAACDDMVGCGRLMLTHAASATFISTRLQKLGHGLQCSFHG